jgi:hypothetical protein
MKFIAMLLNLFMNKDIEQKEKFEPKWEKPIIGYSEGNYLKKADTRPLIGHEHKNRPIGTTNVIIGEDPNNNK